VSLPCWCVPAGLRQSLATAGALLGSSVSGLVFLATGQSYEATFVAAIIPPAVAAAWLMTVRWRKAPSIIMCVECVFNLDLFRTCFDSVKNHS
jgi:hypothetical protein